MLRGMREKLKEGDMKYLLANEWWVSWQRFVTYDPTSTHVPYSNKHSKHNFYKLHKSKKAKHTDRGYCLDEYEPYEIPEDNEERRYKGPGHIENRYLCQLDARNKVRADGNVNYLQSTLFNRPKKYFGIALTHRS